MKAELGALKGDIQNVYEFWNSESCGERYAIGESLKEKFLSETDERYRLEPYIKEFAQFENFENLDVLEIGVGFGSDHSQIAKNNPKTLTGVDLTNRAIENTNIRFQVLGYKSNLFRDNAENLSFQDNSFDAVYSWGVLHHSPDTEKCFEEVYRVLRPDGFAKIMIYHKHAPVGWMLWVKYALLKGKPFTSLEEVYKNFLESPGTKAYTLSEARKLAKSFSKCDVSVQLSFGDLFEGDVGARHKGFLSKLAKRLYPKAAVRMVSSVFPIGLYLFITARK